MGENYKLIYNVDMVFCIDATGSMGPIIDTVKNNALNFYNDVTNAMREKQKNINKMRIRVIAFRDYIADKDQAMMATDFFELPAQSREFERCIRSIEADGGGDEPEDGLEALAYAIRSNWNQEGTKKRNIIVVWTDASTHPIGYGKSVPGYPRGMADSFSELTEWWGDEEQQGYIANSSKRLVLFSPDVPYWNQVTSSWNNVIHYASTAGEGVKEYSYKEIISAICNSF